MREGRAGDGRRVDATEVELHCSFESWSELGSRTGVFLERKDRR